MLNWWLAGQCRSFKLGKQGNFLEKRELAGEPGLEPGLTESESAVLPLDDSPPCRRCVTLKVRLAALVAIPQRPVNAGSVWNLFFIAIVFHPDGSGRLF